jgi:biopolymer transport protein ExbD
MGMNVGSDSGDEDEVVSAINTTPLVDVMLVLLIIFLITIPVVTQTIQLELPKQRTTPNQTKPENINISVTKDGGVYWGLTKMASNDDLLARLHKEAVKVPQPEVHVRGDQGAHYEYVGKVITDCKRSGIAKVAFITEPPALN